MPGGALAAERPGSESRATLIPEIESLRGIAITLVFLLHADAWVRLRTPGDPGNLVSPLHAFMLAGHTGVSLFFVISGFLLGRPFIAEAAGGRHVAVPAYYRRRALRILPVYWAAVAVGSVARYKFLGGTEIAGDFAYHFIAATPGIRVTAGLAAEWLGVFRFEAGYGAETHQVRFAVDLTRDLWDIL